MSTSQTSKDLDVLIERALEISAYRHQDGKPKAGEALTDFALTLDRARMQLEADGEPYLETAEAFVIAGRNHLLALTRNRHIAVATAEAGEDVLVIVPRWSDVRPLIEAWSRDLPCVVRRATPDQIIDIDSGGTIRFASARSSAHRGMSVDVVYISRDIEITTALLGEVYPCTATSKSGRVLVEVVE